MTEFDKNMAAVAFAEANEPEVAKEFISGGEAKGKKPVGAPAKKPILGNIPKNTHAPCLEIIPIVDQPAGRFHFYSAHRHVIGIYSGNRIIAIVDPGTHPHGSLHFRTGPL